MLTLILSCILAGILGFAAHRASVCTVRGVAELSYSRTGYMLVSIGKSALWVFAFTIPIFLLLPQTGWDISGWQLTGWAMVGGLLFGIGSGINGACAYATMARMVDGEIGMLLTVVGFALGVVTFVAMAGANLVPRPVAGPGFVPVMMTYAPIIGAVLLAWAVYEMVRLWRTRPGGVTLKSMILARQYRLSTSALVMGLAGGAIFLMFGSPGYTTTLQQVVEGYIGSRPGPPYGRWIVLGAVLFGMFSSTWQRKSFPVIRSLAPDIVEIRTESP